MQTLGVVNAFWQSEIQATSTGKLGSKNFVPGLYDSFLYRQVRPQTGSVPDL
jgi:hypothetical protein